MTRSVEWPWTLTHRQGQVFQSKARYLVLPAGRRFGKTVLAITWLCTEVMSREPGALGYYVAPFRVMAKSIAWDMLLKATRGIRVAKNESELTVTLPGNRKIVLKGADDPETLEGVGLVAAVLDEFGRMKLAAWEKSLRPALSDKRGRVLFCGKPRGHNHLKTFYDRGQPGPDHVDGWESWLFTTLEGGHVDSTDIDEARATLPGKVFAQEYLSTFETAAGRVYEDFTRRSHVIPHATLEREFRRGDRWAFRTLVGVDWGYSHNGVMLVGGVTATGRIIIIHEEVHPQTLVAKPGWLQIATDLQTAYRPSEWVADPSEPGHIQALRATLDRYPDAVVRNADNEVGRGILGVQTALLPQRQDGRPGLLVSDACQHTVREFENYVYRDVSGVPSEDPVKVDDHCMDALRYLVRAARP